MDKQVGRTAKWNLNRALSGVIGDRGCSDYPGPDERQDGAILMLVAR
jgi:hypothetical protein